MKKLAVIFMMMIGVFFLVACDDEDKGARLYDVTVEVVYPDGYEFDSRAGIPVVMSNMLTGVDVQDVTNAAGKVEFAVEAGTYNLTSVFETEEFAFNGILQNQSVEEDGLMFVIDLNAVAKTGGFVISEIYFAGSRTPQETNYNGDVFVELYNNSDEVLYADGLCIGGHAQNSINPSQWVDGQGNILPRIPITFQTWMLPGTGETYPVQPRTTVVIAIDAINHQEFNPNSPVNLSNADFEAWVDHPNDVDNPAVPNMIQVYTTSPAMNNWTLDVNGKAHLIWRLPTGLDWEAFAADADNFMRNPTTGSGFLMLMVHQDWVVDAVDIVRPEEDRRNKQLPTVLDAGYVWNPNGRGHSVRRKVDKIIDGNVFLKNTNNSSEDWIGGVVPVAGSVPNVVD
jgi:hypothetical protein